ncbi:hypothetical protein HQ865_16800 [Mucilaginibacter mali]|uniref:Carboxypeptidase regulatory-like domain-containing protein n=1 Tax=Mucilaginibacter mali TaxID=2740462 RepID=A0A7D4QUV6_9SPHI|nr:hypothetical protein [Mucilaginibacter mali]QKJ31349.1 hypothetical protein HQ865_16800 [Mucilaginibacter mali]
MKKLYQPLLCYFLPVLMLAFSTTQSRAQQATDTTGIKKLLDKAEAWQKAFAPEKVYLNFDKPYYASGDTAWIKAYVLMDNKASTYSSKLYVELLNSSGKMVQRLVLPTANGLATGYFPLDAKTIPEDSYTVRAYTNWQQNFGPEAFYYRQFYVGKLGGKTWLVTEQNRNDNPADTNHVQLAMRFTDAKGLLLVTRRLNVRVLENNKPLLKNEMSTGIDGTLTGAFTLPAKANHRALSIVVEDAGDKEQHITFPFYPSGTNGDIDLQFMPEGGTLVAGIYNKVGFKAIGEDGLGRDIKATVIDSKGEEAATLQSLHNGMGSFVLVPQAGETYTAKVMVNGREKKYALPTAKAAGMGLRVDGVTHGDELYVYVTSNTPDDKRYTLIARSAGKVYFGSAFKFNADNFFNTRIKKELFPTGIISLTILGSDNKPLNQRNVFIDRHDGLRVSATPVQDAYGTKDSAAINLHVTDKAGNPVQANLSVAVTDNAQIKNAVSADNIQSHMLLASELKGYIEEPAWYFSTENDADSKLKEKALDNLLLTQGWQGFDWSKTAAAIPTPDYKPETDISVSGKLTNFFGKPARGVKVMLLSKSKYNNLLTDTLSDNEGRFSFTRLPLMDTVAYLVKLHNGKDKTAAADIAVDEFKPTTTKPTLSYRPAPWNMNTDSTLINYINWANQRNLANDGFVPPGGGKVLKQVDITAKRKIRMVGGEFGVEIANITEEELIAAKKMSAMDLIYKKFPGFREDRMYANDIHSRVGIHPDIQFVNGSLMVQSIIADGQDVSNPASLVTGEDYSGVIATGDDPTGNLPGNAPAEKNARGQTITHGDYTLMKEYLNRLGGEDIKSISMYRGEHLFLTITTRSGKGANAVPSLGTYAYRPPFMQMPRQFYSPKYTVKNTLPDLRSTIHWEPNVVTDPSGNARVSFYTADKSSTYTIIVEGTDMQGHFGVDKGKINVTQAASSVK